MFESPDIHHQLNRLRNKAHSEGGYLISEARKILKDDLFTETKILENLGQYNSNFHFLDDDKLDVHCVFSLADIKKVCSIYRLKFLDSKHYKPEIPYVSVLKIKNLNEHFSKDLKEFKILAPAQTFPNKMRSDDSILFTRTIHGNYYLIHRWGAPLPWHRRFKYWPLRKFETLFLSVICFTLLIALSLPIGLITLDHKAGYWSGYRAAAFFHLLIFNMGVTVYITFAFAKNFSSTIWNRQHDFD